ncbi:alpha/beta hydrolase [uncultured Arcticibacterium sp.]|uniref:alpha/beta hydrolase n=1 Tax=uncultured Arcticibacterium sp. TaxID=2173042 RepID=UPI0030FBF53E
MKFLKWLILGYCLILVMLYLIQDFVIFRANPLPEAYQFKFEQPFVEKNYTAADGTEVNTLFFPTSQKSKGLLFNNHGNRRNLSRWGRSAEQFTSLGYDVFFYDYRGFGKTKGKPSEENIFSDSAFLYEEMKKEYSEDSIIVYGRSLGSGVAAKLAAENNPKMLILESAYYSMAEVGKMHLPIFPYKLLIKHPFDTGSRIDKVKCGVKLIHGTEDRLIPVESSYMLTKKMGKSPEDVLTLLPGGHRGLYRLDQYQKVWKEWLAPELLTP